MTLTDLTLLPTTTYGDPSGNYDGSSSYFAGNAVPAANYYAGLGATQTARLTTVGFQGIIKIQATLGDLFQQTAWFDVDTLDYSSAPITDTVAISIVGNFIWMRVAVDDFTAGTIDSATLVY
jgi:hypothetical protein